MENIKVQILDTTLREGEQTPGVSFKISQKIEIVKLLNQFGVDFIEVGHPIVSKDIYSFIEKVSNLNLDSKIIAHSRLLKADIDQIIDLNVPWVGLFFDINEDHLEKKYGINENDAKLWYKDVNIVAHRYVSQTALETALRVLVQTGVLPKDTLQKVENIIDDRVAELKKDIQAIPLYGGCVSSVVNRLYTTLEKNGYGRNEQLDYETLSKYDQTVYHGVDAVLDCINRCNIKSNSKVLNIGSGMYIFF